ncbi:MAG: RtcB family protein [Kiritimatiellae bacterium]|nr:RtcB family protein [Kiritimatiellia bacterium]
MKWSKQVEGGLEIRSWCGEVEPGAMEQAENLARHPALVGHVALMPDCHQGYGMPIGGVVAADAAVIPAAVGVDIGCGMRAVETSLPAERFADMRVRRALQERLKERIPVGEGVGHKEAQAWEGFEEYLDRNGPTADWCNGLDRRNLGTLGGGNHFIELQRSASPDGGEPEGGARVWLMIHSGSRNLGKRIEERYHLRAANLCARWRVALPDPDLAFLPIDEAEGGAYWRDMLFALRYAEENRRRMMAAFRETVAEFAPEAEFVREIDIHHNYAAFEEHGGRKVCVHRKGATSAKDGEIGIIPGSMGAASYIVRGRGNGASFESCSHGAGRKMSRIAACKTLTPEACDAAMDGIVHERWHSFKKFGKAKKMLDLSEAPQAYKDIEEVIGAELDLVEPLVRLLPMASLKG